MCNHYKSWFVFYQNKILEKTLIFYRTRRGLLRPRSLISLLGKFLFLYKYLLDSLLFDGCHHSPATATPVIYGRDLKWVNGVLTMSKKWENNRMEEIGSIRSVYRDIVYIPTAYHCAYRDKSVATTYDVCLWTCRQPYMTSMCMPQQPRYHYWCRLFSPQKATPLPWY